MTDSDLVEYSSCDLLMRTTFTQDSVWEDLGVTEDSHREAVAQNLAALGWNMVPQTFYCLLLHKPALRYLPAKLRFCLIISRCCRQQWCQCKSLLPGMVQPSCKPCHCQSTHRMKLLYR